MLNFNSNSGHLAITVQCSGVPDENGDITVNMRIDREGDISLMSCAGIGPVTGLSNCKIQALVRRAAITAVEGRSFVSVDPFAKVDHNYTSLAAAM